MKTVWSFFKRFFVILLALTLLVALAFTLYVLISQGAESEVHQAYLKNKMEVISPDGSPDFQIFDQSFYRNQVFLLGETHGYQMPQQLDFALLKHLQARAGVRYYLAQVDYCQAYFLNQYLQTGDESFLRTVFKPWIDEAQWGSQEFYNKIKKIYALNQSLPVQQRITFLGVDKIQYISTVKTFLDAFLADIDYHPVSATKIDSLRAYLTGEAAPKEAVGRYAAAVLADFQQKNSLYQRVLGEQTSAFKHFLKNVSYLASTTPRDSLIFRNLADLTQMLGLGQAKMYGLWGYYHTLQVPLQIGVPFAALIKQSSLPFHNQVVSMNILSLESDMMIPPGFKPYPPNGTVSWLNNNGPFVFVDGIKDLKALTRESTITIFKLDEPDSPYRQSQKLARIKTSIAQSFIPKADAVTTDLFQYAILIRDSKALTPLRGH